MTEQERQALDALLQWLTETLIESREPDRTRGLDLLRRWREAREAQS